MITEKKIYIDIFDRKITIRSNLKLFESSHVAPEPCEEKFASGAKSAIPPHPPQ